MAPETDLTRIPVVAFDRIESLADPAALSSLLGLLSTVERKPLPPASSGREDWDWWVARLTRWSRR